MHIHITLHLLPKLPTHSTSYLSFTYLILEETSPAQNVMSSTLAALIRHDLPPSDIEQQAIARRRQLNEERNRRIFDPKQRTIGMDYNALDQQVQEKIAEKERNKERERDHANYTAKASDIMEILDIRVHKMRAAEAKDLDEYRKMNQTPESRREYDMNRPDFLKYDPAIRADDNCSVSGLQQFAGEDLQNARRIREQHEQSKVWNYMQRKEREQKEAREKQAKQDNDRDLMEMDAHKMTLAAENARHNREEAKRNANYNKDMALQRAQTDLQKQQFDTAYAQQEINDQINGKFLTEDRSQATTQNPGRVLVDSWKGMTVEQKYNVLQTQERQRLEHEARLQREREQSSRFDQNLLAGVRAATSLEEQKRQQQREHNLQVAEENRRLAREQRHRNTFMEKVVYQNAATNDFFNQFNTSSR